jgi:integrase
MKALIDQYIAAHKLSWAESTLKSERSRLYAVADVLDGDAEKLWTALVNRQIKPYARLTAFIRVVSFYDWLITNGLCAHANYYTNFQKRNRRLFKNVYKKRLPNISYRDADRLINQFKDSEVREAARFLLQTGTRVCEASTVQNDSVVGKSNKSRQIYLSSNQKGFDTRLVYPRLYRALKGVGLTPHMLRKICLTRLVELGVSPFELTEIAGWASVNTAASYIQVNKNRIKELMEQVQNVK